MYDQITKSFRLFHEIEQKIQHQYQPMRIGIMEYKFSSYLIGLYRNMTSNFRTKCCPRCITWVDALFFLSGNSGGLTTTAWCRLDSNINCRLVIISRSTTLILPHEAEEYNITPLIP